MFKELPENAVQYLRLKSKERVLPKGTAIYNKGDRSSGFYIIIRGTVRLVTQFRNSSIGDEVIRDRLGRGHVIGLLGFLTETPRHSTVICDSYVQAFWVDHSLLQHVIAMAPMSNLEEMLWKHAGKSCLGLLVCIIADIVSRGLSRRIVPTGI